MCRPGAPRIAIAIGAVLLFTGCSSPVDGPSALPRPASVADFAGGGSLNLSAGDSWALARIFVSSDDWIPSDSGVTLSIEVRPTASPSFEAAATALYTVIDRRIEPFLIEQDLGLSLTGQRTEPLEMDLLLAVVVAGLAADTTITWESNGQATRGKNIGLRVGHGAFLGTYREVADEPVTSFGFNVSDDRQPTAVPGVRGPGRMSMNRDWAVPIRGMSAIELDISIGPPGVADFSIATVIDGTSQEGTRTYGPGFASGGARSIGAGSSGTESLSITMRTPAPRSGITVTAFTVPYDLAELGLTSFPLAVRGGIER